MCCKSLRYERIGGVISHIPQVRLCHHKLETVEQNTNITNTHVQNFPWHLRGPCLKANFSTFPEQLPPCISFIQQLSNVQFTKLSSTTLSPLPGPKASPIHWASTTTIEIKPFPSQSLFNINLNINLSALLVISTSGHPEMHTYFNISASI